MQTSLSAHYAHMHDRSLLAIYKHVGSLISCPGRKQCRATVKRIEIHQLPSLALHHHHDIYTYMHAYTYDISNYVYVWPALLCIMIPIWGTRTYVRPSTGRLDTTPADENEMVLAPDHACVEWNYRNHIIEGSTRCSFNSSRSPRTGEKWSSLALVLIIAC